ncbi:ABC transporter family substrate-binding protein [Streptacidiphilus jiangxiensis]|uniref:Peptide/nickel transport system substrate-binding protein n=1 Tax=Streptacidiphilus jiangxiensis TaxID=235985 RepID=A0A1H7FPN7_STRJI|nr:ABC transporter family substrate-binding protein [Streptacidiphilus jiangxiensis]SEK27891.1 peptide/nickel transport system substrate-binding protein [Streptacidiphilus jiangxiensis]
MVYRNSFVRPPRETTAAVLAAAVALVLAACSGSDTPSVRADDMARADRAAVAQGGTLRWAVDALPTTLNAFQADAGPATTLVDEALLPTLFTLDAQGRATADPDYVQSAEQVAGSPQTVLYTLNPKATWSDGKPLGLADFVGQWHALSGADPAFAAAGAAHADGYDSIAQVTAGAKPHQVKVVFAHPYAPWRSLFTPLYPAAATASPQAFTAGLKSTLTADSGPFTLKGAPGEDGQKTLTVTRNPHWWGDRAKLDSVAFTAVNPGDAAAALASHQVDIADLSRAADDSGDTPDATSGTAVLSAAAPGYLALAFNGGAGLLADPQVRRAVADAVDRQALADAVLKPLGLPAVPLGNHLLMSDQQGYQDDAAALGASAANAAKLLDAAGWRLGAHSDAASGAAIRANGAKPLSLTLLTRTGSARDVTLARLLTAQLAKVGIGVTAKPVAEADFFTKHIAAGDFDLALVNWPASPFPIADEAGFFAKPQVNQDGSLSVGQNLSATGTDEIDQLLARAAAAGTPADATRLTNEADIRIWQEAPSLPLFQSPELVGLRAGVRNAGAFGFATPRFQDIGFAAGKG